ncbi:DMT family transporter [Chromobacterium sp.]|uniref:DMT family transporter n=1 Tax=Chromobacterium sp. TaxID=306190 RepID=UPI0035B381C9
MDTKRLDSPLALAAGAMLAWMIHCNSQLAAHSGPLQASWLAHGLGALTALALWRATARSSPAPAAGRPPRWAYLGGLPGALTVALAAIAVNSPLALAGTLALAIAGQLLFGLLCERFGLLAARRALTVHDALAALLVLGGCAVLIFAVQEPI